MCKRLSILTFLIVVFGLVGSASAALNYEYYEAPAGAQYLALADVNFTVAEPNRVGTSDTLDSGDGNWVEQAGGHRADDFGFRFFGYIVVPVSGEITFYLRSDDGSQLFIDGQMVVDNDGLHGTEGFPGDPGTITLDAGAHSFEATQFERGGGDSIHVAWSAGGQDARRIPDSVLFLEAPADISGVPVSVIGTQSAFGPTPADGTVDVVDADVALITWNPGLGSVTYDLYISGDAEIDAGDFVGTLDVPEFAVTDPLIPGAAFYWRVDAVDADGNTHAGDVWALTALPLEAHFPAPADGATLQAIDVQLGWVGGLDALVRDVYFSEDLALVEARDASVKLGFFLSVPTLDPGLLENETTYYWAVDEIDSAFSPNPGPIWSFTTVFGIPITDENLIGWWTFDGVEGGTVLDQSGHGNTGVEVGAPDHVGGVLGEAIGLDGSQAVDLGLNDSFNPTGSFTVAVWANATAWNNSWGHAMMGNRGESGIGWQLRRFGGNPTVSFTTRGIGNDDNPESNVPMPLNEWVHIAAVYDNTNNTKTLYFNGGIVGENDTDPGSVNPTSHNVYIGARANGGNSGPEAFFQGSLDDVRYYDIPLNQVEVVALAMPAVGDVTGPGDVVVGVPDEARDGSIAGWPDGEYPGLAFDDNTGTKFLHFKGEVEPTGFRVAPDMGPTVVTGLTFTTANDSPERDPITYELSGSNESLDGPYEVIASGDIVDFNQVDATPRFTKNSTAIMFENGTAYLYYQVMFPTVRDAGAANSMQIAEVELLGVPAVGPSIVFVSFHGADDAPSGAAAGVGFTEASDKAYTDLLSAQGYDVSRMITSGSPDVGLLNAADLVIISRAVSSGNYSNDSATTWNGVTSPMIILGGYVLRSSRMGFTTGTTMVDTTGDVMLTVNDPAHPIFAGIDLVDGTMVNPFAGGAVVLPTDGTTVSRGISINDNEANADGTVLAVISEASAGTGPVGGLVIGEWSAGATMEHSGGAGTDILAGNRLVFLTGSREPSGVTGGDAAGLYDLFPDGELMLLNAVDYMLP